MRTLRAVAAIAALAVCTTRPARAQSESSGRIEGIVFDSVHARALSGAHVVAVGTGSRSEVRSEATTDSAGRYHLDGLPLGRYVVGFETALLDSLELTLSPREATVTPGNVAHLDLAMPPAVKLRAAVCPGVRLPDGSGVVYGQVVNAETESPMPGVSVAFQWRELGVWDSNDHKLPRAVRTERVASATTDEGGWYRACGVATGSWMSMQLQHEGRVGAALHTMVDDTLGISILHLSFSPASARDTSEFADSTKLALLTGNATLTGVVRGPTGVPVQAAQVHVLGARGIATTDAEGNYTLSGLPAGTHEIEVRRLGYGLADGWVNLRNGAAAKSDVRMMRVVNLDSIRVVAISTRYKQFAEHRKMGLGGYFLGPDELLHKHVSRTSDIFRGMPGLVVRNSSRTGRSLVYAAGMGQSCVVNVAINGLIGWSDDPEASSVDDVPPNEVGAIEIGGGNVIGGGGGPSEYGRGSGCGTIVIWTKR